MNISDMKQIVINKNRGWRGLSCVEIHNEKGELITKYIFSFSQDVWEDLINRNQIVIADNDYYYVIHFTDTVRGLLPNPTQQRSVLIKDFIANIDKVSMVAKTDYTKADISDYMPIMHYRKNKNNHTQSNWNCIRNTCCSIYIKDERGDKSERSLERYLRI